MIMTKEQAILKAKIQFNQMEASVRKAAAEGQTIDQVERDLWERLLSIGRMMLQGYVKLQGSGDVGATLKYEGRSLNRLDNLHERRYVSVFGELKISRTVYGTRETQKHEVIPLDARLGLPDSEFSYLLAEWDQSFCVQGSYEQSRRTVERILGIGQSVLSLEDMNQSMSRNVQAFRDSRPMPVAQDEGSILVLTADGKGVPMRRDPEKDAPAIHVRRKKGQKANKKRQACVGAVYTIEPFVRTAKDVVNEVMRDRRRKDRPPPQNKKMRAELTRIIDDAEVNGKDLIFSWFAKEIKARDGNNGKAVVCVMDGDRALWKMLKHHVSGDVVCILDLFHVMERLWNAAHCFYLEGGEEAKAFVSDRLERILEGQVGRVIGGLRQMGTKRKLSKARMKQLSEAVGYLYRNRRFMHYDEYLANGYPIGSGVVEGACRHLVKDRMELTGMRWRTVGAQAMLDLRSVFLNGDWDAFQQHRIEKDHRKLYPYKKIIESQWNAAA